MDEFYSMETVFFNQICHYPETWWNHHFAAFFEISLLKEVLILCLSSPEKSYNDANTKGSK